MQIFTKTREESLPSLKKYSKNLPENDSADHGKIVIERTYAEVDDPDQKEIPESEHTKAYNYGKQLVPVSAENEHVLKLGPQKSKDDEDTPLADDDIKMKQNGVEKQFKLLGFTD